MTHHQPSFFNQWVTIDDLRDLVGMYKHAADFGGLICATQPTFDADIVNRHPSIKKARLTVSQVDSADSMLLSCEASASFDVDVVKASIRDITKLRGEVQLVSNGSLPNDGKVIEDCRRYS